MQKDQLEDFLDSLADPRSQVRVANQCNSSSAAVEAPAQAAKKEEAEAAQHRKLADAVRTSQAQAKSAHIDPGNLLNVKVGEYWISRLLGKGTFSHVFLGTHLATRRDYAIKVIEKVALDKRRQELLRREVSVMKCLNHDNIVSMKEICQTTGAFFLVLELVDGGTMNDVIRKNTIRNEEDVLRYFRQIVSAVHYCHSQNVAHRDLKPDNMLITAEGLVKISDFGLSKQQHASYTADQSVCGTPYYVAPEVIAEHAYNGFKVDIWSLGVMLYLMASGKQPFAAATLPELFTRIKAGEYTMVPTFSPDLKDLISKMLLVDTKKRLPIEGVISHPFLRLSPDQYSSTDNNINPLDEAIREVQIVEGRREEIVQMTAQDPEDLMGEMMSALRVPQ